MSINAKGVHQSNRMALQRMIRQQRGAIVNISSVLGMVGTRDHFTTHAYAEAKFITGTAMPVEGGWTLQ